MIEYHAPTGSHILQACKEAIATAIEKDDSVRFLFNGTEVIATKDDTAEALQAKWMQDRDAAAEAYRNSDEYREAVRMEEEERQRKLALVLTESAQTPEELRDTKVPWPYTPKQLLEYIQSLIHRQHDYNTVPYAMALAAVAAFNYVAHELGSSGFQAGFGELDVLRRTYHDDAPTAALDTFRRSRNLSGPFMIVKAENDLYPQFNIFEQLNSARLKWIPWLKEEAKRRIAEDDAQEDPRMRAHPEVRGRWELVLNFSEDRQDTEFEDLFATLQRLTFTTLLKPTPPPEPEPVAVAAATPEPAPEQTEPEPPATAKPTEE